MSTVIAEDFEHKQKQRQNAAAAAEQRLAQLKEETGSLTKTLSQQREELKKKDALKSQAEGAGLDTAPLKAQMEAIQRDIESISQRIQRNASLADGSASASPNTDFEHHVRASAVLKELGCVTADVVPAIGDCAHVMRIAINDIKHDELGHPTECRVRFDSRSSLTVPLTGGDRYYTTSFRPKPLQWLPGEAPAVDVNSKTQPHMLGDTKKQDDHPLAAFVHADSDRLIVTFDPDDLWDIDPEDRSGDSWREFQRAYKPVEPKPKRGGITSWGSSWEDKEYSRQLSDHHAEVQKYNGVRARAYHAAISQVSL